MSRAAFRASILAALAIGLWLRSGDLALRPMHTDEAVHAEKFRQLWLEHSYRYDPEEFHGPTLYYATLPVVWFSGVKDFESTTEAMYRTVPLIFTLGLIALLPQIADGLGRRAAAWAALLTAVSPAFVFYGRYYIQEPLLVFFTFAAIACGWRFFRSRRIVWAILAGIAGGLMHATKETAIIQLACLGAALALTWRLSRRRAAQPPSAVRDENQPSSVKRLPTSAAPQAGASGGAPHACAWGSDAERRRGTARTVLSILLGLCAAVLTSVALYSNFFTYLAGPWDSIRTYLTYFDRAGNHGLHNHPWYFYFHRLLFIRWWPGPAWSEAAIVVAALFGIAAALVRLASDRSLLREAPAVNDPVLPPTNPLLRKDRLETGPPRYDRSETGVTGKEQSETDPRRAFEAGYQSVANVAQSPSAVRQSSEPSESRRTKLSYSTDAYKPDTPYLGLLIFLTLYTVLLTAAYTLISYKTTWCMLGFLHGMILLAGVGIAAILRSCRDRDERAIVVLLGLAAAANLAWQANRANSAKFCASNYNPYVYAHPVNDLLNLPRWLDKLVAVDPAGHSLLIKVFSPDAWPVPWYLRRFTRVGYWERVPPDADAPVVIVWPSLVEDFEKTRRDDYQSSLIGLRPGVVLTVYTRRSLYDAFAAAEKDRR